MPPNFTDYEASSSYTTELSSTWVPLLTSIAADVAFFDGATSSLAQQLAAAKAVANDYEARLVVLEAALGDANAIATAVVSAIGGVELRVVTGALALEAEFAYLSALWLATAENFTAAALQNYVAGMQEYESALSEFGRWVALGQGDRLGSREELGM